jgi:hypothetical protein
LLEVKRLKGKYKAKELLRHALNIQVSKELIEDIIDSFYHAKAEEAVFKEVS